MNIDLILVKVVDIIKILILIRIILSWVMPQRNEFTQLVHDVTEPMLRPFRVVIPLGSAYMDLAPIILIFLLEFLKVIIRRIF